jgi:tRNA A37 methylthiotransferase MiaB
MLSRKKRKAFYERILGRTVPVLVEKEGEDGTRFGFTDNYIKVGIPADSAPGNAIVPVEILQTDGEVCTGRFLPQGPPRENHPVSGKHCAELDFRSVTTCRS